MSNKPVCHECGEYLCCGKAFHTAYGKLLCPDCYDDYLFTDEGKVEYILDLAAGNCSIESLGAEFLGHAIVQWYKYKKYLWMSADIIEYIEKRVGIFGLGNPA